MRVWKLNKEQIANLERQNRIHGKLKGARDEARRYNDTDTEPFEVVRVEDAYSGWFIGYAVVDATAVYLEEKKNYRY